MSAASGTRGRSRLSVNRKGYTDELELRGKIETKIACDREAGRPRDDFYRVITIRCGDVRGLVDEDGRRLFCVYDTANIDDISHADVCQAFDPPPKAEGRRSLRKKISSRLFDAFVAAGKPTDLATVYSTDN